MNFLKNLKKKIKIAKRAFFYSKIASILFIVGSVLTFITIFHSIELIQHIDPKSGNFIPFYGYEFLTLLSLDFSIVLIPTLISLNNIRKSFKKDKNKIFTLLEELIMLRYDISDIILNKAGTRLIVHPVIVRHIKESLRHFGFTPEVDFIHYLIKQNRLWHIDYIITLVIIRTKSFDGGKEFRRRKNEVRAEIEDIEKNKNKFSRYYNLEENPYKKKCIENLGFVLAYELYGAGPKSLPVYSIYREKDTNQ